jgi:hypothetical protein
MTTDGGRRTNLRRPTMPFGPNALGVEAVTRLAVSQPISGRP